MAASGRTGTDLPRGSRWLLTGSIVLGLSILYQVYIYDFEQGVLSGGESSRLVLKALAAGVFVAALRPYLSIRAFALNLPLKLPLLFVAATILCISPFLTPDYKQALNLLFFLPVFLIDWNRYGADALFRLIWKIVTSVVLIQLVLDPVCKLYFHAGWDNAAVIGGMGNPNVFGVFLICAGLACRFLLRDSRLGRFGPLLFVATVATGSLAASLVGVTCLLIQLVFLTLHRPVRGAAVAGVLLGILSGSTILFEILTDSPSITHAFQKAESLQQLLAGGGAESDSFSIRIQYLRTGLEMLSDSPAGIIVGHPGAVPMYNGDGLLTSFIVTYGVPVTLSFLAANLWAVSRARRRSSSETRFSGAVVLAFLAFFVTNRILDYWPTALAYLLSFSYLTNKGFRAAGSLAAAPHELKGAAVS